MLKSILLEQINNEWLEQQQFTQSIQYYWDRISVEAVSSLSPTEAINQEIMEGYWFGQHGVLHVYKEYDMHKAVWLNDNELTEPELYKTYTSTRVIQQERFGEQLIVKHYLTQDDDGQWTLSYTRPYALK